MELMSINMQKEMRPVSSHVDQTSFIKKGFTGIIRDKEQIFTAGHRVLS